jgi:hypothetical protein
VFGPTRSAIRFSHPDRHTVESGHLLVLDARGEVLADIDTHKE